MLAFNHPGSPTHNQSQHQYKRNAPQYQDDFHMLDSSASQSALEYPCQVPTSPLWAEIDESLSGRSSWHSSSASHVRCDSPRTTHKKRRWSLLDAIARPFRSTTPSGDRQSESTSTIEEPPMNRESAPLLRVKSRKTVNPLFQRQGSPKQMYQGPDHSSTDEVVLGKTSRRDQKAARSKKSVRHLKPAPEELPPKPPPRPSLRFKNREDCENRNTQSSRFRKGQASNKNKREAKASDEELALLNAEVAALPSTKDIKRIADIGMVEREQRKSKHGNRRFKSGGSVKRQTTGRWKQGRSTEMETDNTVNQSNSNGTRKSRPIKRDEKSVRLANRPLPTAPEAQSRTRSKGNKCHRGDHRGKDVHKSSRRHNQSSTPSARGQNPVKHGRGVKIQGPSAHSRLIASASTDEQTFLAEREFAVKKRREDNRRKREQQQQKRMETDSVITTLHDRDNTSASNIRHQSNKGGKKISRTSTGKWHGTRASNGAHDDREGKHNSQHQPSDEHQKGVGKKKHMHRKGTGKFAANRQSLGSVAEDKISEQDYTSRHQKLNRSRPATGKWHARLSTAAGDTTVHKEAITSTKIRTITICDDSDADNIVLMKSIELAEAAWQELAEYQELFEGDVAHDSQLNVDEGSEAIVPSWRLEQINQKLQDQIIGLTRKQGRRFRQKLHKIKVKQNMIAGLIEQAFYSGDAGC